MAVGLRNPTEDRTMNPDLIRLDQGVLEDSAGRGGEPVAIGEILAELLSQYQARFPEPSATLYSPSVARDTVCPARICSGAAAFRC
jgi:hypothetical protein